MKNDNRIVVPAVFAGQTNYMTLEDVKAAGSCSDEIDPPDHSKPREISLQEADELGRQLWEA